MTKPSERIFRPSKWYAFLQLGGGASVGVGSLSIVLLLAGETQAFTVLLICLGGVVVAWVITIVVARRYVVVVDDLGVHEQRLLSRHTTTWEEISDVKIFKAWGDFWGTSASLVVGQKNVPVPTVSRWLSIPNTRKRFVDAVASRCRGDGHPRDSIG